MFIKAWQIRMGDQIFNLGFTTRSSLDMGKLLQLLLLKIKPQSLHKTYKALNGLAFTCILSPQSLIATPVVTYNDSSLDRRFGKYHEGFGHKQWDFGLVASHHLVG